MLKNIKIIQIEIFDTKKLHSQKFEKIKKILSDESFILKKIRNTWSSQQFSNTKSADALFIKEI